MKAIKYCEYGPPDVLKVEEVEKPVPKDNELLVRVRAASLNFIDAGLVRGPSILRLMSGLRKPKFTGFGRDFAGVVEAVGKNVTEFKPGDEVFGVKMRRNRGVRMRSQRPRRSEAGQHHLRASRRGWAARA